MIAFVKGNFVKKTPAQVIVDVNGVGYELNISLNTFSFISNLDSGMLLTYLHITENGHTLFGFSEQSEKDLFLQLISVSGVGASTARMMLSGMKPLEIIRAIVQSNNRQLEAIKGIGKKTAERIVLELKDKVGKISADETVLEPSALNNIQHDALNALISLGIARNMAEVALKKVYQQTNEELSIENIIKLALKNL